ncbi:MULTISPECIES: hypothetical protein [Serratia]|uniref:hypothetical protein n=1 Tax=Serratia TaxID=613 RepID=UPI0006601658|nr:hypothetical protein [Serratia sp. 506_PEND]
MYYKTEHSAVLAAWDRYIAVNKRLSAEARELEVAIGGHCRAVFKSDTSGRRFHGLHFDGDDIPFGAALWTRQTQDTGYSCRPRAKPPKGLSAELKALRALWEAKRPKTAASYDELYAATGLDFSVVFFGGLEWFRVGDIVYIRCGMKPNDRLTEILSSEYLAAKRQAEASA